MQKYWNLPVSDSESIQHRLARYTEYFSLKESQVHHIYKEMLETLKDSSKNPGSKCLKMLDTCVDKLPTGNEKGVSYAVEVSVNCIRCVRCKLDGKKRMTTTERKLDLENVACSSDLKGLMGPKTGAMEFFDAIAETVKSLMEYHGEGSPAVPVPVAFAIGFPCHQTSIAGATLIQWTKGFETGRDTSDPVEGINMGTLLDMAFWRKQVHAKCVVCVNDATATILAAEYEKAPTLPPVSVSYLCAVGVNGVYMGTDKISHSYVSNLINTEIGNYDVCLPVTDLDLEVDYADNGGHGTQLFEKMIGGGYLGEVCRRLVVKVFQTDAPTLAWARHSLPTAAAAMCVVDLSENLDVVRQIAGGLWDWQLSREEALTIKDLFAQVFDRSAALSACAIGALAKSTGRLQPAMGGVTVALEGSLHGAHPWHTENIRSHLKKILKDNSKFIHLYILDDPVVKGAAVLAVSMNASLN